MCLASSQPRTAFSSLRNSGASVRSTGSEEVVVDAAVLIGQLANLGFAACHTDNLSLTMPSAKRIWRTDCENSSTGESFQPKQVSLPCQEAVHDKRRLGNQRRGRIGNQPAEHLEESRRRRAVHDAMIEGQAQSYHIAANNLVVDHDRPALDPSNAQNSALGIINDRCEGIDAARSQVRDSKGAALHFFGGEPALAGPIDQLARPRG